MNSPFFVAVGQWFELTAHTISGVLGGDKPLPVVYRLLLGASCADVDVLLLGAPQCGSARRPWNGALGGPRQDWCALAQDLACKGPSNQRLGGLHVTSPGAHGPGKSL